MHLEATLITKEANIATLSINSDQGQQTVYWPINLIPKSLNIGDPFEIAIGVKIKPRQETNEGKSATELRKLLYDLIN